MRQLTESEQEALTQARTDLFDGVTFEEFDKYVIANAVFFKSALDYTADRIAALEAERDALRLEAEGLRAALTPFAENAEVWEPNESHFVLVYSRRGVKGKPDLAIRVGDLLEARRALDNPTT